MKRDEKVRRDRILCESNPGVNDGPPWASVSVTREHGGLQIQDGWGALGCRKRGIVKVGRRQDPATWGNVEGRFGACEQEKSPSTRNRKEGEPSGASEPDRPNDQGGPRMPERGDQPDRKRAGGRRKSRELRPSGLMGRQDLDRKTTESSEQGKTPPQRTSHRLRAFRR